MQREAAPPTPDLEDVIVGPEAERVAQPVVLASLRVFERLTGGSMHSRRVGHRLVEEERE